MKSKTLKVVPALGALAVVLLWLLGAQAAAQELLITDKNNGQAFTVRVGQKITVTCGTRGAAGRWPAFPAPSAGWEGGLGMGRDLRFLALPPEKILRGKLKLPPAQKVVEMDDAQDFALIVHHREHHDGLLLHELQRLGG
jgi:hypothetical protein